MANPVTPGPDPVRVAPQTYKVLFENDRVRVLDIRLAPGAKSPLHAHPCYVSVALSRFKLRLTLADGSTRQMVFSEGQTGWSDGEVHSVENIGEFDMHSLNIELKG